MIVSVLSPVIRCTYRGARRAAGNAQGKRFRDPRRKSVPSQTSINYARSSPAPVTAVRHLSTLRTTEPGILRHGPCPFQVQPRVKAGNRVGHRPLLTCARGFVDFVPECRFSKAPPQCRPVDGFGLPSECGAALVTAKTQVDRCLARSGFSAPICAGCVEMLLTPCARNS